MPPPAFSRRPVRMLALFAGSFLVVALGLFLYVGPRRLGWMGSACAADPPRQMNYQKSFQLEDMIPDLCRAAGLSPEEGVKVLLQRVPLIRVDIAAMLQRRCHLEGTRGTSSSDPICQAKLGDAILESAIDEVVDGIVKRRLKSSGNMTSADYNSVLPLFVSWTVAMRMHNSAEANLFFELSRGTSYSLSGVEQQYGQPTGQLVDSEGYTVFSYHRNTDAYEISMTFRSDPGSSQVQRISIGLTKHFP